MEKSAHKLKLIERIAELEEKELWHIDVEDDPESYPLMPDQVDYLNEKFSSKLKNKIANLNLCLKHREVIKYEILLFRKTRSGSLRHKRPALS